LGSREKTSTESAFVDGFGVDGETVDLGESFFDAVFEGGGDVVHLSDGQIAVHGAVAGYEDFVLDETNMYIVAISKFVKFGSERIDEILNARGESFHFLSADDLRAERLDMDVHGGFAADGAKQIVLKFRGEAMRIAKARMFIHLEMKFDEQAAIYLMRG